MKLYLVLVLLVGPLLGVRCPSQPRAVDLQVRRLNAVRAGVDVLADCGMEPYATQAWFYLSTVTFDADLQRLRYDAVAVLSAPKRVIFNPQMVDLYPPRSLRRAWGMSSEENGIVWLYNQDPRWRGAGSPMHADYADAVATALRTPDLSALVARTHPLPLQPRQGDHRGCLCPDGGLPAPAGIAPRYPADSTL